MNTLRDRVQALVGETGLSVNAAASAIGMPQPTLAGILSGRTKEPRWSVLEQIAKHFGVSEEWLRTGAGRGISDQVAPDQAWTTEVFRWDDLVIELQIPEPAHSALLNLPMATAQATTRLMLPLLAAKGKPQVGPRVTDPLRRAASDEYRAWITWLEEWIALAGREAVREAITANAKAFRMRFAPYKFAPYRTNAAILAVGATTPRRGRRDKHPR